MARAHERVQQAPISQVIMHLAALIGGIAALLFFVGVGGRWLKKL